MILRIMGIIFLYIFICYANYRIIRKFNHGITVLWNLIPFWNIFLLVKLVDPARATLATMLFFITINYPHQGVGLYFMGFTNCCLWAWIYGSIANRLGKNVWVHAVLAFFVIPLIVMIPIMAFDDSRPFSDTEIDVKL